MSADGSRDGDAGEAVFIALASENWGARFVHTPRASGSDGYLCWDDMPGIRLWVEIKTSRGTPGKSDWLSTEIKSNKLREWSSIRPLLVRCLLPECRAWWIDTAEFKWPWDTRQQRTFRVPLSQPVDTSTKDVVRKIALRRARYLPAFVLPAWAASYAYPGRQIVPYELNRLSPETMFTMVKNAYQRMSSVSILDRDVTALTVARMIHCNLPNLSSNSLDAFLDLVSGRLLSGQWGGRSYTMGALTSILRPSVSFGFDRGFLKKLLPAAERAVLSGTFVNPEFGLLIAASLGERFPHQSEPLDLLEYLICQVRERPQNAFLDSIAIKLGMWLSQKNRPLITNMFSDSWLSQQVVRPLSQDADVFLDREEAGRATTRAIEHWLTGVSRQDLTLVDELTRLRASYLLEEWLG